MNNFKPRKIKGLEYTFNKEQFHWAWKGLKGEPWVTVSTLGKLITIDLLEMRDALNIESCSEYHGLLEKIMPDFYKAEERDAFTADYIIIIARD